MKNFIFLLSALLVACNHAREPVAIAETSAVKEEMHPVEIIGSPGNDVCWNGLVNDKIPVFIHYQADVDVIAGEIIYLGTKDRKPIKLIGTIQEDKTYRLLEFEASGNITGIITGIPSGNTFNGDWFSPKTRKEFTLRLNRKDTIVPSPVIKVEFPQIFGDYSYQYSKDGYEGEFHISKIKNDQVKFDILSVTGAPSRNIAEVPEDTIHLTEIQFIYKIPDSDSCEFKVKFYRDFLYINYTKGYCIGQFGNNASVDGIFLKTY